MNKAQDLGWAYAHQIRTSTHSQGFFSSLFFASYLFLFLIFWIVVKSLI